MILQRQHTKLPFGIYDVIETEARVKLVENLKETNKQSNKQVNNNKKTGKWVIKILFEVP